MKNTWFECFMYIIMGFTGACVIFYAIAKYNEVSPIIMKQCTATKRIVSYPDRYEFQVYMCPDAQFCHYETTYESKTDSDMMRFCK